MLPPDARYARQRGWLRWLAEQQPAAAPLPLLGAQRASGAGRLAHEPCGRQKRCTPHGVLDRGIRTVLISDVAIMFEEDVIRHTQEFLARRRAMRPQEEYRPVTDREWFEFEEHFDKRKVELGSCGRPYGTDCHHEHACLRCPQLHVNPKMLPRLDELETDLEQRRTRATAEGWIGEIEGIDRTLSCLRGKRADALRLTRITQQVDLGMPAVTSPR
jgi:hypothetical protein